MASLVRQAATKIFLAVSRPYLNYLDRSRTLRNLIVWPIASRIFGTDYSALTKLKSGILMQIDLHDALGRMVIFYGPGRRYFWEPATTKLMEMLICDAEEALVAGAHIGYMALIARQAMHKASAKLHALEPVGYLFAIAKRNFLLNKLLGDMTITHAALSDHSGTGKIVVNSLASHLTETNTATAGARMETVRTITVDDYAGAHGLAKIDFLLLDVEGYELNVFQGMEKIFAARPPRDIIYEVNCGSEPEIVKFNALTDLLLEHSYDLYFIEDDYRMKNPRWEPAEIKLYRWKGAETFDKRHCNMLATKRSGKDLMNMGIKT